MSSSSASESPSEQVPGPQQPVRPVPTLGDLSAQAARLHALGLVATIRADSGGLIGRSDAERLAATAGALVEELVEAGFWVETDLSYVIRAGALAEALHEG